MNGAGAREWGRDTGGVSNTKRPCRQANGNQLVAQEDARGFSAYKGETKARCRRYTKAQRRALMICILVQHAKSYKLNWCQVNTPDTT